MGRSIGLSDRLQLGQMYATKIARNQIADKLSVLSDKFYIFARCLKMSGRGTPQREKRQFFCH
jgi:hypothetical protein